MPLHVWLKEPPMQILIKGDLLIPKQWKKKRFGIFRRMMHVSADNGSDLLFDAANVLIVKTVTAKEIAEAEERKKAMEEAAAKQGRIAKPAMMIPGMRKAN